jgi:hypothetical protein
MFRSAPSINSRKAKETQHETISPPCAGRSRPPEFGWYLIKRVRRGSSAVMPAPIYLTILVCSSPSGFQGGKRAGHSAGPSWSARSAVARVPAQPFLGRAVSVARRYLFPPYRTQLCRSDLTNCPTQNRIGSIKHGPIAEGGAGLRRGKATHWYWRSSPRSLLKLLNSFSVRH